MNLTINNFLKEFNQIKQSENYKNRENKNITLEFWFDPNFIEITLNNLNVGTEKKIAKVNLTKPNTFTIASIDQVPLSNDIFMQLTQLITNLANTSIENR